MVTKKRRRSRLARERVERQAFRRHQREVRRRRVQFIMIGAAVAVAVAALILWITRHGNDSAAVGATGVYYDALPVDRNTTLNAEVTP